MELSTGNKSFSQCKPNEFSQAISQISHPIKVKQVN